MVAGSGNAGPPIPAKAGAAEATRTNADAMMRFMLPTFRVILSQMKQLSRRKGKACKNSRLMILAFPTVTHVYDNAGLVAPCALGAQREMSSGKRAAPGAGEGVRRLGDSGRPS